MNSTEKTISKTYSELMQVARKQLAFDPSSAILFALTWLAASKICVSHRINPALLVAPLGWQQMEEHGLSLEHSLRGLLEDNEEMSAVRAVSLGIVLQLNKEMGEQPWDVLPVFVESCFRNRAHSFESEIAPAAADLLIDMMEGQKGETLWVPFDASGSLTIRALRQGWKVKTASMLGQPSSVLPLLLAIEYGSPSHDDVDGEIARDAQGRPATTASHILAIPPFAASTQQSTMAATWASTDASHGFNRSEAWAINELMSRATEQAVFVVPPSVLFSGGQERRLREHLLYRDGDLNQLQAVVALPPGALAGAGIATAILATCPKGHSREVRMVDLGLSRRSLAEVNETILAGRDLALGIVTDNELSRGVTRDEIKDCEFSLAPSRYLTKPVDVGPDAVVLDELCDVLRPPLLVKESSATELQELGIQDLGAWAPVTGPFDKKVRARARQLPTLEKGDVVLSVKGTIGKVALVGEVIPKTAIMSQSSVVLRLKKDSGITPEYLLMYLQSQEAQAQLERLQIGSALQYVNPSSLVTAFRVPVLSKKEQDQVCEDYSQLCSLEMQIRLTQSDMSRIAQSHWKI